MLVIWFWNSGPTSLKIKWSFSFETFPPFPFQTVESTEAYHKLEEEISGRYSLNTKNEGSLAILRRHFLDGDNMENFARLFGN